MWVILFFDLPVESASERKIYAEFKKMLRKKAFHALQKSVYLRWTDTTASAHFCISEIKKNCPPYGELAILCLTENNIKSSLFFHGGKSVKAPEKPEPFLIF